MALSSRLNLSSAENVTLYDVIVNGNTHYLASAYLLCDESCSLVVICWERANFMALYYEMYSCVFVTFPYGILGQVWYLIVLIPDLCLHPSFVEKMQTIVCVSNYGPLLFI